MSPTPYGAWTSPIAPDALTTGALGLEPGPIEAGVAYWSQSRPDEGGRTSLWCQDAQGHRRELTPGLDVHSTVHEYGGTAWAVRDGMVIAQTAPAQQVVLLRDGATRELTEADCGLRFADFDLHPELGLALAVREDHRAEGRECRNEIVALRLDGDNSDGGRVLCSGADFYAAPRLSADGRLAWIEWDHPNMPWDHTRLRVASLDADALTLGQARLVAGGDSAPSHPVWRGEELLFVDDASGFWNFYALRAGEVARLNDDEHDYCRPPWVFEEAFVALPDGRIACAREQDGLEQLGWLDADGVFTPDSRETSGVSLRGGDGEVMALLEWPDRAPTLERIAPDGMIEVLARGFELELDPASISAGQSRRWHSPDGEVQAWFYPPRNAAAEAPEGERPPLRVLVHGGPTGMTTNGLRLAVQFWTTRGFAVLDVNYGGSGGFGRAYRERLRGQWGVVDVRDCVDGARELASAGLVDPERMAIEGRSAGGYTTLAALTMTDAFSAGNSLYGIADLAVLAGDTHKFESRYTDGLIGGTPDEVPEIYAARSPLEHLDGLNCPMLIQQGTADRVVPPNQATLMADAVRAKGLPVALVMFDGEGHGWRRAETIVASLEAGLSFYGQVFGFEPAGVARLEVENLG